MALFLAVIFFVFGLIIGSFLNVVIFRMNTARSLGGRSACMSCQNKLCWYELIPLVSFLGLKGRCRICQTKISIQYPIVEALTGLIFVSLFFKFSVLGESALGGKNLLIFSVTYAYYALMFSLLVVVATYDIKHKIIPDILVLIFGLLAFIGLFFFNSNSFPIFYFHLPAVFELLSGVLIAAPFAFFWLISSGRWMGLGDAKLALGIGWLLGLTGALSGLVVAFWTGAVVGLCLVVFRKNYGLKSEIPFAPYLVLGAFLAFIFGLNLFGI